jgi:hypothetical protein
VSGKIPILTHTGIFKLELSWRGLGGSFHNKLAWAQILAEGNRVTLSIEDSTLATSCASSMELDIEQSGGGGGGGGGVDQALIPQKNAYLHIDVFRIDQVVRNMITNAVCMYVCMRMTFKVAVVKRGCD